MKKKTWTSSSSHKRKSTQKSVRSLTAKQQRFVDEYLRDLKATGAAVRAGYSKNRAAEIGYQLLQKTTVSAAVAEAMSKRSKETGIDAKYVLVQAVKIHERCMREGHFNAVGAIKSLELIGKHVNVRAFMDRVEVHEKTLEQLLDESNDLGSEEANRESVQPEPPKPEPAPQNPQPRSNAPKKPAVEVAMPYFDRDPVPRSDRARDEWDPHN
jgi:phage terminase small subunit